MKVREPVARPLDVVGMELLLSASQAFLVGVLMYLAIGVWDDRGVGSGPVAIILALLGLAVGSAWMYWLLGGVGWPLAAADAPVAMFLGFAMVLGWAGDDLFRVSGVPLLLATLAAVYGIVSGVFLESPRRWRWDQRARPRPGATVPRVSGSTRKVIAAVPRSLPTRAPAAPPPSSDLATRIGKATPPAPGSGAADSKPTEAAAGSPNGPPAPVPPSTTPAAPSAAAPPDPPERPASSSATSQRHGTGSTPPVGSVTRAAERGQDDRGTTGTIELPTSFEPKAQRSPWAWAAPPDWTRDDEDERAATTRSSSRS